jgi:arylsulfatase A
MTGRFNVRNYLNFGTLDPKATTFAHYLKKAGYATAIAGKWQLGQGAELPRHFGFDEACLWQHTRRPPRYANPGLEYNGVARDFTNGEYGPKLVNDFALDFITRQKARPFFLYYPMILTHEPFQPTPDSPDWEPKAADEKANRDAKHFADMVAYMDNMIGRLVAKLDELNLRDNTLLIFLGDNGSPRDITSQFQGRPYPGGKGSTTARGTRVPLIVNWPAQIKTGRVNRDLISSTDFLPTLCAAAGAPVTGSAATDGRSFLPQLLGQAAQPREWLYTWYSPRQRADLTVREFAFDHDYKLYRTGELYHLATDPFEQQPLKTNSLSAEAAAAAKTLQGVLDQFKDARPAELDRAFEESFATNPPATKKKKSGAGKRKQ